MTFDMGSQFRTGLPPADKPWGGIPRFSFVGGNNDEANVPFGGLAEAALSTRCLGKAERWPSTTSEAVRWVMSGSASSWPTSCNPAPRWSVPPTTCCSPRDPCRRSTWSTSCSSNRGTPSSSRRTYGGLINRLARAASTGRHPARRDGMRIDALSNRSTISSARDSAEVHLHHSDRAEPDRHHPARGTAPGDAEAGSGAWRADLRGRLLCRPDLGGERPPALHAMSERGGVIHCGSFSKSIAPACGSATSLRLAGPGARCWR